MTLITFAVGSALGLGLGLGLWLVVLSLPPRAPRLARGHSSRRVGGLLSRVERLLEESGHAKLDSRSFLALSAVVSLSLGSLVVLIVPIPALAIVVVGATAVLVRGYLARQREKRQQILRKAWPGVIDHLRAAIRSGSDVTMALCALPDSLPRDIVVPLERFRADIERGLPTDTALERLGNILADPVGDRIIEVLRMAHEVGGWNLPSVLLDLQRSVRTDIAVREDASAQQSWIRSAANLAVAAPWVVLLVIGTRDQTITAYQGAQGSVVLLVGALVSVIAYSLMKSIGALPEPRRWVS